MVVLKEMKTRRAFDRFHCSRTQPLIVGMAVMGFTLLALIAVSPAAELKEARVSQVIKDVRLLPAQAAPRAAVVSDQVRDGTAVRTGVDSRAELTFTDQTLARLGRAIPRDAGRRPLQLRADGVHQCQLRPGIGRGPPLVIDRNVVGLDDIAFSIQHRRHPVGRAVGRILSVIAGTCS